MEEKVSIIVPVYNARNYIKGTIDCVRRQTYQNWELLLILDGCSDGTDEVVSEYLEQLQDERIIVIRQSNQGAARARNLGVSRAAGRYIAYLDADDLWTRDKLSHQVSFMQDRQAAFSFTGSERGRKRQDRTRSSGYGICRRVEKHHDLYLYSDV